MQTLREIRGLLDEAGLSPRRQFGQCFLIDGNLLRKLVALADLAGGETVLEVGPGTGSLTEELLARGATVVAAEIDRGLCELLNGRLGEREEFVLVRGDVLAGKHAISPAVLAALGDGGVHMVANLPYNVATPLVAECLVQSWRAARSGGRGGCVFERLTFTVQREVAERLTAGEGGATYGPVSVLAGVLGRIRPGANVPASAFWPRPKVASRMVRIDFDAAAAGRVADVDVLRRVVSLAFAQRRKQVGSMLRRSGLPLAAEVLAAGLSAAGIDPRRRAEEICPAAYVRFGNAVAERLQ